MDYVEDDLGMIGVVFGQLDLGKAGLCQLLALFEGRTQHRFEHWRGIRE